MLRRGFLLITLNLLAFATATASPSEDFATLLDDAWEWRLDQNPVFASMLGDKRANDQWSDQSLAAIEQRYQDQRDFMARLQAIDSSQLDETERLNYDLFRRELQDDLDANKYRNYLMPISHRGGVPSLESLAERIPLRTVADYEDWLARMSKTDEVLEQTKDLMEAGRREGYMPPKILMERVPDQLAAQLVEEPSQSRFARS